MTDFKALRNRLIEKDFGSMNEMQFEAVTTVNGPLLVLAGAGSGKTTVLVNRIAYLVKYGSAYHSSFEPAYSDEDIAAAENYLAGRDGELPERIFSVNAPRPWEILAITFTNKAAGELRERINAKLTDGGESIWAGTFHSICGRMLRKNAERIGYTPHFTVYDTDDQRRLMKQIIKDEGIDEKFLPHRAVLSAISSAKDSLTAPDELIKNAGSDIRLKKTAQLYRLYNQRLRAADAMDFDDMICETVRLLRENPDILEYYASRFKYIMVDEYQDTNHSQYTLVNLLSSINGNLCVVGDDDQSIYRFRGATIENILNFEEDFPGAKTIRLEQNYRSTGNILNAANAVISHNRGRKGKKLWTDRGNGDKLSVYTASDERSEATFIAEQILENVREGNRFSDNAVLYRMNAQSVAIENVFAKSGIAYKIVGGFRFFDRKEIRDVLAYLNLINNNSDDVRLRRIINEPKRGIGETTVNRGTDIAAALGLSLFEVFASADDYPSLSRASAKLKEFCCIISKLTELSSSLSLSELFEKMLELTGYRAALLSDNSEEARERLENVNEFSSTLKQYEEEHSEPLLSEFLEEIALFSDLDSMDENEDCVILMTIHSAKGLEFNRVFLVGMEEGIFPGTQSIFGGESEIEEERRLAYVAITRAKKQLFITKSQSRLFFGKTDRNLPSRFLREIPSELCDELSASDIHGFRTYDSSGFGNRDILGSNNTMHKSRSGGYGEKEFSFANRPPKPILSGNEPKAYSIGQTVEHRVFGKGIIASAVPMGGDVMLTVNFETAGTKKIMASFAKLKII